MVLVSLVIILLTFSQVYCKFLHLDPEVTLNITEVIRYHGYPCEDHDVVTKDGYILTIQRIKYGRNNSQTGPKPPIFLQHGLLDSAHAWASNLPYESLAFILADAGYEVWLGNSRGNTYSSRHINLTVDQSKFWDFSFVEMARFDLPSVIDYILQTNRNFTKLAAYIGHSQGTLIFFSHMPSDAKLSSKVKCFIGLGPVTHVGHVELLLRVLSKFRRDLEALLHLVGHGRFMSSSPLIKWLGSTFCNDKDLSRICSDIIFMIAGYDLTNMNETRLPVYIAHTPAGTSIKNVVHFAQMVATGKWQQYDYGYIGNLIKYGSSKPPQYSLKNFAVPTMLVSGGHDVLADPTDVQQLMGDLGANLKQHINVDQYNHLDFTWSINAYSQIYPQMMDFIRQHA